MNGSKDLEIETQYVVIEYMENFIMDPKNQYSLIPLNIGLNDPKAIEGLQQYNDALLERMKLLKSTNINNPAIEIGNEQLNAMRLNLLNTVKGIKNEWFKRFCKRNKKRMKKKRFLDGKETEIGCMDV